MANGAAVFVALTMLTLQPAGDDELGQVSQVAE
jgi:hypothetical protein